MEEPAKLNGESSMSAEESGEATLAELGIAPESPTRLSQEHFDLFIPAVRELQAATADTQVAMRQLSQAQHAESAAKGALLYVVKHVRAKYGMKDGDDIDEDGVIIRAK